jgi:hypothetical protein
MPGAEAFRHLLHHRQELIQTIAVRPEAACLTAAASARLRDAGSTVAIIVTFAPHRLANPNLANLSSRFCA